MKNEHVVNLLDDYVDGELSGETLRMVETHLASCPSCRKEAEELKRLTSGLGRLPLEIEPPEGIALPALPDRGFSIHRLFAFRRNGTAAPDRAPIEGGGLLRFSSPAFIGRAAAVLAIALCGTLAWYVFRPSSPDVAGTGIAQGVVQEPGAGADRPPQSGGETPVPATAAEAGKNGGGQLSASGAPVPAGREPAKAEALKNESRARDVVKSAGAGEATRVPDEEAPVQAVAKPGTDDAAQTEMPAPEQGVAAKSSAARSFSQAAGTGSLSGTVRDGSWGEALFGVNVLVLGTTRGATSDPDGKYTIMNIPAGLYDLRASAIGYETIEVKDVAIAADSTALMDFTMTTEEVNVQGITVTADQALVNSHQASRAATAAPKTEGVAKEAIEGIPDVKTVDDVLKLQAGAVKQGNNLYLRGGRVSEVYGLAPDAAPGTESYDRIYESGFRDASVQPKSTFSIDVDAASYSNIRRFLDDGQLPPADAVRIEEMINYFTYNYPRPERGRPFSVTTQMGECPWNRDNLLMLVGIKGREIDPRDLPPGNLVFLIDVSGSMASQDKLPLLKSAFRLLVEELRPRDRVSIVVYAGRAGLVLPPTRGDRKETILDAIDALEAGGSTAGGAGIRLAYDQAREAFIEGGNNRVILATDGDFNIGVSSDEEMVRLIEKQRNDGIFLSVLGFGTGNLKDSKMEKIADKGNGAYYYVDNMKEARKVFGRQLSGTLYTIAKDVKIQVEFDPHAVSSYRLIGYENRVMNNRDFRDDRKDAGELGAGHTVTALYEIVPVGSERDDEEEVARLERPGRRRVDRDSRRETEEPATVSLRYKEPDASTSRELRFAVRDERPAIYDAPEELRFAAAVAEFGMMLRDSEFRGTASFRQVLRLAEGALGRDPGGYRAEFVRLVEEFERLVDRD